MLTILGLLACSEGSPASPSQEAPNEARASQPAEPTQPAAPNAPPRPQPPAGSGAVPPVAELTQQLATLPDSVLVGTDVVPLAGYLDSAAAIPSSGLFQSEQGGATARVRLASGPQGATLTRELTEPGTKAQVRRYDVLRSSANGVRLSGAELEVLGATPGLLVLEKRSGVDGIPGSLWIEYARSTISAARKEE